MVYDSSGKTTDFREAIIFAVFLWILCFLLANLEVQIEGPNGWASALPTWKSNDPRITWIFGGRPLTGYHVYLNLLLLSFFHFPFLFTKFSWEKEARILSSFSLLAVVWDFMWFIINPYYGIEKYRPENIWWFKHWVFGFPVDYFFGILASFVIMIFPGFWLKSKLTKYLLVWGTQFVIINILTIFLVLIS